MNEFSKLVLKKLAGKFKEEDHPRANDGKFGDKGSGNKAEPKIKKQPWDESVKDTPEYDVRKSDREIKKIKKEIASIKEKHDPTEKIKGDHAEKMAKIKAQLDQMKKNYEERFGKPYVPKSKDKKMSADKKRLAANLGQLVRSKMKEMSADLSGEYIDKMGKHFGLSLAGDAYTVSYGGDAKREVEITKPQAIKLAGNCRKLETAENNEKDNKMNLGKLVDAKMKQLAASDKETMIAKIKAIQSKQSGQKYSDAFLNAQSYSDLVNIKEKLEGKNGAGHPFED